MRFSGSFLKSVSLSLLGLIYHLVGTFDLRGPSFKPPFLSLPNNFYIKDLFYSCLFLNCCFGSLSYYSSHMTLIQQNFNVCFSTSSSMVLSSQSPCLLFLYGNLKFSSRSLVKFFTLSFLIISISFPVLGTPLQTPQGPSIILLLTYLVFLSLFPMHGVYSPTAPAFIYPFSWNSLTLKTFIVFTLLLCRPLVMWYFSAKTFLWLPCFKQFSKVCHAASPYFALFFPAFIILSDIWYAC